MSLSEKKIEELIHRDFACSCGHTHRADIEHVVIGEGAIGQLVPILLEQKLANGRVFDPASDTVFAVTDVHTHPIAEAYVFPLLREANISFTEYSFPHEKMHTTDAGVEELRANLPSDTSLLIAIGSGTINDLSRFVAFHANLPYYIIGTAPSMDGYASDVSPIIHNNLKTTFSAVCAKTIIGDPALMQGCPALMIGAGLGDIIGKYVAINDWKISQKINGEYCCDEVCDLVLASVKKCVDSVPGLTKRDPQALQYLMESLVLSGMAISFIGTSRPASSSEHHLAHFMEMQSIFRGEYGELHGTNVGLSTCIVSKLYQEFLKLDLDYDKARAHAKAFDPVRWEADVRRFYQSAADEVIKLEQTAKKNDPEEVLRRIDALEANEGFVRAMVEQLVDRTKDTASLLESLDGLTSPKTAGVTRENMRGILLYAKELRNRYSALQIFYDLGVLEELADRVLDYYYGEE